mmetsp:Transcript_31845/g.62656  ORF Transcript_31845/g.62656 Transcript_31845/m.62656 type:complete len:365 (-) Transcript_31845:116-1210(-)
MGNQLPSRCIVPCNPQCCALCIHGEVGKADEEDITKVGVQEYNDAHHRHRAKGGIFANAAAVLTAGAENAVVDEHRDRRDLMPNDHLERELANEVELWRMETGSTAVHRIALADATTVSADAAALGSTAATVAGVSMPFADMRRASRDRSVSPPLRTQVSLHDRAGLGHSHTAGPHSTKGRPFAFGVEDRRPCGDDPAGFVCSGSRGATASTACEEPCDPCTDEGAAANGGCGAGAATPTAAPTSEAAAAGTSNSPAAASPVRENVGSTGGTLNSMFFEGLPDDAADTREVEAFSSSDESTFAGFIEDPYEQQRAAEVYSWTGDSPNSQRVTMAYSLASESPAPNLGTLSSLSEDVRPDRSLYF